MKKNLLLFFLLIFKFSFGHYFSQSSPIDSLIKMKYREDQFYFGTNYVILESKESNVQQSDFSSQINLGILRDFPLNNNGTFAFALGFGSSYTQMKSNIDFDTGKLSLQEFNSSRFASLVIPFELRWRSSNHNVYSFWRAYFGTQIHYNFIGNIPGLKKWSNSVSLNFGYNTWNFSIGYDLSPRFNYSNNESINNIRLFRLGLIFYLF
ncbi:MAG: hypothetical protein CMC79_04045 [Flavobacteriaceae bacterium]|nr:hypothetical protein [Flavobacteriaceae bacterium]|tara:strand:- start:66057 stop:66680 length:624 start_codon:yes stop_codon:yes gene_type:complete